MLLLYNQWMGGVNMKDIVIAFDGSVHAINAVLDAKKLVEGFVNSKIIVLNVVDISEADATFYGLSNLHSKESKHRIDKLRKQLDDILDTYEVELLIGDPATEIINYVSGSEYDLLVMGIRGLNIVQSLVMGSVCHKVLKNVSIPVLVSR